MRSLLIKLLLRFFEHLVLTFDDLGHRHFHNPMRCYEYASARDNSKFGKAFNQTSCDLSTHKAYANLNESGLLSKGSSQPFKLALDTAIRGRHSSSAQPKETDDE
mmetsp:Transcript_21000/g.35350  ORF Transcript_21000/g.35350 Transcript_21000/m.35350 type:complete len:105 (+) Transcript_21000:461-775(+)